MNQFKIRPARESDYETVESMTRQLHALDYKGVPGLLKHDPKVILPKSAFLGVLEGNYETYFVAECLEHVVGLAYVSIAEQGDATMAKLKEAEIGVLYVDAAWRRQGVATALLERVEKWAKSKKADRLVTIVYPYARSAKALYESINLRPRSIKLDRSL